MIDSLPAPLAINRVPYLEAGTPITAASAAVLLATKKLLPKRWESRAQKRGAALARLQQHCGLRPRGPTDDLRPTVLVALDLEWEKETGQLTQIGMAKATPRPEDLQQHDVGCWLARAETLHILVQGFEDHQGSKHTRTHPRMFAFGTSEIVAPEALLERVRSFAFSTSARVVLVFHAAANDIKRLREIGLDILDPHASPIVDIQDTQCLGAAVKQLELQAKDNGRPAFDESPNLWSPGLERACTEYNVRVPATSLHNAGNDALHVMLLTFALLHASVEGGAVGVFGWPWFSPTVDVGPAHLELIP